MSETTEDPIGQDTPSLGASSGVVSSPVHETSPVPSPTVPAAAPSWLEQDEILKDLWGQQLQPTEIAEKLNRSVAAVMTRAARLGLPRRFAPGRKAGQRYARPAQPLPSKKTATSTREQQQNRGIAVEEDHPVVLKERVCLMCLRKFESEGPHNRICPACKGSSEYAAGSRIPDINFGTGV